MTSRSTSALRKPAAQRKAVPRTSTAKAPGKTRNGIKAAKLPEWNLTDLYSGIGAPEVTRPREDGCRLRRV
jgi:oligoendopeptidase F